MRPSPAHWCLLALALACFSCAQTGPRSEIAAQAPPPAESVAAAPTAEAQPPLPAGGGAAGEVRLRDGIGREQAQAIGIDDILDAPPKANVFWGVSVRSLSTGQSLFARNEEKLFTPASNMKLLTTAVALTRLGPDFRYTTALYGTGQREGGVLKGDVFLRGSGDPTISERFQGRATAVFEGWADTLKRQGVREIRGDLVGDDTLFDDRDLGPGWAWDDEFLAFSARISAVSFNDNCFEAIVSPGERVGDPARIEISPKTAYIKLTNGVRTSSVAEPSDLDARRAFGTGGIVLSGRIGLSSTPRRLRFSVDNPTLYAVTVLKEVLERKGIRVRGRALDIGHKDTGRPDKPAPDYGAMQVIVSHQSEPLSKIIEHVNKRSQNLYAELLFRTLGAIYGGRGTTEKAGQVVKESLAAMGIPGDSLAVYDGSGLSRLNLVTPSQVVLVLDYMSHHPYFDYYYRSLPIAGVDGTLMKRMKDTPAEKNVRAKTGTLTHTAALSGYFKDPEGGLFAFSIMNNNYLTPASVVRSLQDAVCEKLVSVISLWSRHP